MKNIFKALAALAAVAGVIYIIAAYGDKIVAWAKRVLPGCPCQSQPECPACPVPEEEAPAAEPEVEEAPVKEVVVSDSEPSADDSDFED